MCDLTEMVQPVQGCFPICEMEMLIFPTRQSFGGGMKYPIQGACTVRGLEVTPNLSFASWQIFLLGPEMCGPLILGISPCPLSLAC